MPCRPRSYLAGAALALATGIAHTDSWHPWVPGIADISGPGVNIRIPCNPLPPGQVKHALDDLVPDYGSGSGQGN